MRDSVFVICAHSDDQILGPGGTIAKYAREGKEIFTIIFSYGESSHIWLKRKVSVKLRVREAQAADRVIGGSGVVFLGLKEGTFIDQVRERNIKSQLKKLIRQKKPFRIFTHAVDDAHEDHRAVYRTVTEVIDELEYQGDLLCFDIWNIVDLRKRSLPKVFVDITDTFAIKVKALNCFKSQIVAMFPPYVGVFINAKIHGLKNNSRYAEKFYKAR